MAGINSAESKAAQSGPLSVVTSDAAGDLATTSLASLGMVSPGEITDINNRLNDLTVQNDKAFTGIAMAFAMSSMPQLQPGEKVAVASSFGTFQGRDGGALSAAVRLFDHAQFNAGLGLGFSNKIAGGQVGFRFGW
jgi:trimeric autotransporter adhesin